MTAGGATVPSVSRSRGAEIKQFQLLTAGGDGFHANIGDVVTAADI